VLACLLSLHRQVQESIHVLVGVRCNPQWIELLDYLPQDAAIASLVLEKAKALGLGRIWFR
jgi:hypothetical protein